MDPIVTAVGASVLSSALTGLTTSVLTANRVTAVMDEKVSEVRRRVDALENGKVDRSVATVQHEAIIGKIIDVRDALKGQIDAAFDDVSREREHRRRNEEQIGVLRDELARRGLT